MMSNFTTMENENDVYLEWKSRRTKARQENVGEKKEEVEGTSNIKRINDSRKQKQFKGDFVKLCCEKTLKNLIRQKLAKYLDFRCVAKVGEI